MSDDDVLADMEKQLNEVDIPIDQLNVQELSDLQLTQELAETRTKLYDIKEMMHPKTDEGRSLHSRRAALLIENNRRFSQGYR